MGRLELALGIKNLAI